MQGGKQSRAKVGLTPLYVAEKMPSPAPFTAAILGICVNGVCCAPVRGKKKKRISWSQVALMSSDVNVAVAVAVAADRKGSVTLVRAVKGG